MAKKVAIVVHRCDKCPFFTDSLDTDTYPYAHCNDRKKILVRDFNGNFEIPDTCELENNEQ